MTSETVYTSKEKALVQALAKIKELCRPDQELYHSQCIDVMGDCFNIAKEAIDTVTK